MTEEYIDFPTFFLLWADLQGWDVPDFHFDILVHLENYENWKNDVGQLMVFRGAGKSTILGLYVIWLLVNDPTRRILILSADYKTAKKITSDCQAIIARHPLAHHLRDRASEQTWRVDQFFVRGSNDARNASVSAYGIGQNVVGSRADFAIFDDVEVPKNCRNDDLRYELRRRISEINHILVPGGHKLFVGTPHTEETIYEENIEKGVSGLKIPLLTNISGEFPNLQGNSAWKERFTAKVVAARQLSSSKGEFLSQYQLLPYSPEDSILDPSLLEIYEDEIKYEMANDVRRATIGEHRIASVSAFWDVSVSKARGDDSVLAIVFTSTDGHIFIHRTIGLEGDVDQQCEQVKQALIDLQVPMVIVETNGVGAFVPQVLLKHIRGTGIGVDGQFSSMNKQQRIIEAFETPLYGGFLHIHESVAQTKFMTQMRDFSASRKQDHDDFIDAPASAILKEPIRIGRAGQSLDPLSLYWKKDNSSELTLDMATLD